MKTLQQSKRLSRRLPGHATFIFVATAALAAVFWLLAGNHGLAAPATCPVCHKNTTTINLPCGSLEYQRHLDHGDTAMACPATSMNRDPEGILRKKE